MSKKRGLVCLVSIFAVVFSVSLVSAQTEGIPLQKDVILGVPIYGPEDLPEEITFTLYDAQNGLTPLGAQTFTRGQYTVDFEFSQSDGVTGGSVARVKADFTQPLNLKDPFGQTLKPKELWAALEVAGAEVGARTKVSDETLVRLLLNSDASLATYLTLAYEGDDNPLTTIYKSLPLSSVSSDGSTTSLSNYFSSLTESRDFGANVNWVDIGTGSYILGNVGIRTTNPKYPLTVAGIINSEANGNYYGAWFGGEANTADPSINVGEWHTLYGKMFWDNSNRSITFQTTNGSTYPNVLVIKNDKVGIGSTLPGARLTVGANFGTTIDGTSSGKGLIGSNVRLNGILPEVIQTHPSFGAIGLNFLWGGSLAISGKAGSVTSGDTLSEYVRVTSSGRVGIGTSNPAYELAVNGTIRCKQLIVDTGWADFVFDDNFRLPQLDNVEKFIKEHKHLPGIPTEAEVKEKGVSVGNISSKLLQKIEELTLYVIDINKENKSLKAQLSDMKAQLEKSKN